MNHIKPEIGDKRVHIAIFAPSIGSEGNPLYWTGILLELAKRNFTTSVFTFDSIESPIEKNLVNFITIPHTSIKYKRIPILWHLARILRYDNSEVYFVSEFSALSLTVILLAKFLQNKKTVLMVENHPEFLKPYGIFRDTPARKAYRTIVCALSDVIMTNNKRTSEYLTHELHVQYRKIVTGPYLTSNFVTKSIRNMDLRNLRSERKIEIACVGQFIERKGYLELIDTISKFGDDIRQKFSIHLYGKGPLLEKVRSKLESSGAHETIIIAGSFPYGELGGRLIKHDIMLIPTMGDYRSLVAFEALSIGLPIIISKYDGSSEEVLMPIGSTPINGYSYDPKDPDTLKSVLLRLINDTQLLYRLKIGARLLKETYSTNRAGGVFADAYHLANGNFPNSD